MSVDTSIMPYSVEIYPVIVQKSSNKECPCTHKKWKKNNLLAQNIILVYHLYDYRSFRQHIFHSLFFDR